MTFTLDRKAIWKKSFERDSLENLRNEVSLESLIPERQRAGLLNCRRFPPALCWGTGQTFFGISPKKCAFSPHH